MTLFDYPNTPGFKEADTAKKAAEEAEARDAEFARIFSGKPRMGPF